MGGRKLAAFVHINSTVYGPGDEVPADVAKRITNPKAWGESPEPTPADSAAAEAAEAAAPKAKPVKTAAKKTAAKSGN